MKLLPLLLAIIVLFSSVFAQYEGGEMMGYEGGAIAGGEMASGTIAGGAVAGGAMGSGENAGAPAEPAKKKGFFGKVASAVKNKIKSTRESFRETKAYIKEDLANAKRKVKNFFR
jgi:hypothetical protein